MNSPVQTEEIFFSERGFGKKIGLGESPCLIVIDVINGFTNTSSPLGFNLSPQVEKINQLLDIAHRLDFPVFFTTISYDDEKLLDSGIWIKKMEGLTTLKTGTTAVMLDPRLHFRKGDTLMVKKYASAFFGTDLVSRLNSKLIDTTIITGCTTCGCVRATAVDALQYGYRPIIIEDAVGDRSEASHTQSLFDLRQKYADVLTTEQVLQKLQRG